MAPAILSPIVQKSTNGNPLAAEPSCPVPFNAPMKDPYLRNELASSAAPVALPVSISDPNCAGPSGRVQ